MERFRGNAASGCENAVVWTPRAGMARGSGSPHRENWADLRSAQRPAGPRAVPCRPPSRDAGTGPAALRTVSVTPMYGSRRTLGFPPRRDHLGTGGPSRRPPSAGCADRRSAFPCGRHHLAPSTFRVRVFSCPAGCAGGPIMGVSPGGGLRTGIGVSCGGRWARPDPLWLKQCPFLSCGSYRS